MNVLKIGQLMDINEAIYRSKCPQENCKGTIEIEDVIMDFGSWGFTLVCDNCGARFSADMKKVKIELIDDEEDED